MRLAIGGVLALFACTAAPNPPVRPFSVPASAAWVSGAFIDCNRVADVLRASDHQPHAELDGTFDCDVFDERGAIQAKGRYRLLDVDGAPAREPRAVMQFDRVDGARIVLLGGRALVRTP